MESGRIMFLVQEGERLATAPQAPLLGRESVWEYAAAAPAPQESSRAALGGDTPLLLIAPDFVKLGKVATLRKALGQRFFAAEGAGMCAGLPQTELAEIMTDESMRISSEAAILFDDLAAQPDGYSALAWFFSPSVVFLSLALVQDHIVTARQVLLSNADALSSSLITEINRLQNQHGGGRDWRFNFAPVFFNGQQAQIAACCEQLRRELPAAWEIAAERINIDEPLPFASMWEVQHDWFLPLRCCDYPLSYVSLWLFWLTLAVQGLSIGGVSATLTAVNFYQHHQIEQQIAKSQRGMKRATRQLGRLARTNIGKYAALYGLSAQTTQAFAEAVYHPALKMKISARGGQWRAVAPLPRSSIQALEIWQQLREQLPPSCSSQLIFNPDLKGGTLEVKCSGW